MSKNTPVIEKDEVVVRFSGDSGDGMQLTGTLFSDTAALYGNDLVTFPDYPAEIRAPPAAGAAPPRSWRHAAGAAPGAAPPRGAAPPCP